MTEDFQRCLELLADSSTNPQWGSVMESILRSVLDLALEEYETKH